MFIPYAFHINYYKQCMTCQRWWETPFLSSSPYYRFWYFYCLPSLLPCSFPVPFICPTHHLSIYQQRCNGFTLTYSDLFSQFPSPAMNSTDNTSTELYHSPTGALWNHISLNINALNWKSSYVTKNSAVMLTKAQIPHFYCMCHSTPQSSKNYEGVLISP